MFNFARREDGDVSARNTISRNMSVKNSSSFRMIGLRHNPYVGSFHHGNNAAGEVSSSTEYTNKLKNIIMTESKNNPLVGIFRHSPSSIGAVNTLGLKCILFAENEKPKKVISQLQVAKRTKLLAKKEFLASLKRIPSKVFSLSQQSQSSEISSPLQDDSSGSVEVDNQRPQCSICMELYEDGDELLTLTCSHCFHSDCVGEWFYQGCLDRDKVDIKPFNCPECRQDHIMPTSSATSRPITSEDPPPGISPPSVAAEEAHSTISPPNQSNVSTEIIQIVIEAEGPPPPPLQLEIDLHNNEVNEENHPMNTNDTDKNNNNHNNHHTTTSNINNDSNGIEELYLSDEKSHLTLHQIPHLIETDEYEIPSMAFVSIGKAIAESDYGYDFLSDAGSETLRTSTQHSPIKSPKNPIQKKSEKESKQSRIHKSKHEKKGTTTMKSALDEIDGDEDYVNLGWK
mmetsp:Transcript_11379/g.15646  ORF Transcript_11379/g.15646 Transcript_11379/m.15646 type:complete len:456 (+) Transcript_11379:72-1439(+)